MRGRPDPQDWWREHVDLLRQGRTRLKLDVQRTLAAWLLMEYRTTHRLLGNMNDARPGKSDKAVKRMMEFLENRCRHISGLMDTLHDPFSRKDWLTALSHLDADPAGCRIADTEEAEGEPDAPHDLGGEG